MLVVPSSFSFFFNYPATTEIYTLSLHDALPISPSAAPRAEARYRRGQRASRRRAAAGRSEEHTSELQSLRHLVCRLLLEKKKISHVRVVSFEGKRRRLAHDAHHIHR